jgi:hypothetical protein
MLEIFFLSLAAMKNKERTAQMNLSSKIANNLEEEVS